MSHLSYQRVEPWMDIVAIEHQILEFWKASNAFDVLREKNKGKPPYSFLDGPITANNPMGVHHAWGRTLKDAYQRYWAMNGRELRYQNGFDCQGLWVEVEVEKELKLSSKKDVEAYGIDRFVEACKERVRKYSSVQTAQSVRLGMWMDWDNSYFTMSEENNYTIWSFLKKCHQRGKIYRGTDVMPWSGRSGSAYSQMEIIEGRKLVAHTALFVRFPLTSPGHEKENLLVWTTTPWTLTSNVAAAVNSELNYVKLRNRRDGELYYFAEENLNFQRLDRQFREKKEWIDGVPKLKTIAQMFNERGGFEIEGVVKGSELVGLTYQGPFDDLPAQALAGGFPFAQEGIASARDSHRVIDGGRDSHGDPIVVAGEGTGIVHIAPGCGDVDHVLGNVLKLPMIAPLDEGACFLEPFGPLAGKRATDPETVAWIIDDLTTRGVIVAKEQYPHIYPHCWRTGDELVFRLVEEWYIKMDWRDEIIKVVDDIRWIPSWGEEREKEWLTNMRDWMISKKRFWGLALPIWVCEACNHFEVLGGYEELQSRAIEGWDQFVGKTPHRPWIDRVKIRCEECGGKAQRIKDVGNPWLDAGIVPYSTVNYNSDRDYWKKWVPADLVLECFPGQFRNWFYSLLATSTMMEGIAPFKTLVGHALVRDERGEEMHKSKGNAIWFDNAAEESGADVMRWLYVRQEPTNNLNFGAGPLREVRGKFINTLWNTYSFFINYARLVEFRPPLDGCFTADTNLDDYDDFDRWILSELQHTIAVCREQIESYDLRAAARAIEEFVENLSGWYVRHNRRRFWKSLDDVNGRTAFETLYECVYTVIRLAAPMIPFVTENMYQNLVRAIHPEAPISVHHTEYPQMREFLVASGITDEMRAIMRINSLALAARESKKLKVRQPLSLLTIGPRDELEKRACERFSQMIVEDLNVKQVSICAVGTACPIRYEVKPDFKRLGARLGKQMKPFTQALQAQHAFVLEKLRGGATELIIELEGDSVTIQADDVQLVAQIPDDLASIEEKGTWVAFNTTLTEELITEGVMRDLLRRLQVLRKDSQLEIEDRIRLRWKSASPQIQTVFSTWGSFMAEELLCVELTSADAIENPARIEMGSDVVEIQLTKVNGVTSNV